MIRVPIRLDRVQQALVNMVRSAVADGTRITWSYQEQTQQTQPSGLLVTLRMISGPDPYHQHRARGTAILPPTNMDLRVDSVAPGQRVILRLNRETFFHDVLIGDTVDTVRDSIVAQVEADIDYGLVSAAALPGAGEYRITATYNGAIRRVELQGDQVVLAAPESTTPVIVTDGTSTAIVAVDVFSTATTPRDGAWAASAQIQAAMQSHGLERDVQQLNLGYWGRGPTTDLSSVVGGSQWKSHTMFEQTVAMPSCWVQDASIIETVGVTTIFTSGLTPVATESQTVQQP